MRRGRNPLRRGRTCAEARGMSRLHDWIDWLGGYPLRDGGLGCNEFVFVRHVY